MAKRKSAVDSVFSAIPGSTSISDALAEDELKFRIDINNSSVSEIIDEYLRIVSARKEYLEDLPKVGKILQNKENEGVYKLTGTEKTAFPADTSFPGTGC
ncbi:MAG: hypothetical protein ABIH89_05475 [Elusimicrobiota bacterium]